MRKTGLALALFVPAVIATAGPVEEARALADEGDYDRAVAVLERSLATSQDVPQALILLARVSSERGDWKQGIEYGQRAVEQASESSEAHFVYALALRTKMQNVSKMKAMFSLGTYKRELAAAIELDPDNVEARSEEIGFLLNAPGFAGGSIEKAEERIEQLEPLDWRQALEFRVELYQKQDDEEGVLAVYEKIIERDPDDLATRLQMGYLLQRAGRYEEADLLFGKLAASEQPMWSMNARYQLARSRILGEYQVQKAVDYLLDFIERLDAPLDGVPSKSAAYWRLGMAYELLDRVDAAREAYEAALELDGDNKEARASLKKLH